MLCSLASGAQVTNNDCQAFRTGKFEMDSDFGKIKIDRHKRYQVEYFTIGGKKYKSRFSITWNDSCNYTLIFIKSTLPEYNDVEAQPLRVKITSVEGNAYTYTCQMDGKNFVQEGKIEKLK